MVYSAIGWLVWDKLIKFSWCQKASTPGYREEWTVAINFDSNGLDQVEAEQAQATINEVVSDPKGWQRAGYSFSFDKRPDDVTFHITSADKLAGLQNCSAQYSCRVGRDIYISQDRWWFGSPSLHIPLVQYQAMIINHELGHLLGIDHWQCYGHGVKAPVMIQQSLGLGGLMPNEWPTEAEIKSLLKTNHR